MRWDIFCKVIDNHGDAGVCWRLACNLASSGDTVRLWIDDGAALGWMAPQGFAGVSVLPWTNELPVAHVQDAPPDVLVEAFGCDPAPAVIERFAQAGKVDGVKHVWINLEYLSAEPYVERLHGLPSPVFRGPGEGLTKHFFYPGFTPATGGLLREPDLMARRARFDRAAWLAGQGIDWQGERLVSLFSYEPVALRSLLVQLRDGPPTRLIVTPGRSAAAVRGLLKTEALGGGLALTWLPHVPQPDFDHMLWSCDLNFVRGEDSVVRALWAGAPLVWQIYPQDDDVHHVKLAAFLDWLGAPESLRKFHHQWNGFSDAPLVVPDAKALENWRGTIHSARARLMEQDDLATRLRGFVAQKS
ncbi:elongation factor P maturation arginine rhamnosyltransferase EarP [Variovorax sp. J22R133]|uniref:elongation factor P maturation arginine rhamnosyltransferase EarP n=1 Tax=Variovorax brevis TaxID=3053503 RepID=UPI00257836BB|nr:elongation factor P maturation arginine rhamnosyltransferase EarP [Variovorax sp. J22R133]MDM0113205.1 elongation factor P maturation arginine rhamnosyltransferase EarP [Variovorax sp. J22R133]